MELRTDASALEFAGFWRRLAAFIIDAIIAGALVGAITSIFLPFTWLPFWGSGAHWIPLFRGTAQNIISSAVNIAYAAGFWAWRGQTPGKMLLNIKVIRTDGSGVSLGYALLRYLGYVVNGLTLGIGFLWIAFDARKQGLHDKIADTYVVKLPQPVRTEVFPAAKPSTG